MTTFFAWATSGYGPDGTTELFGQELIELIEDER
jgi:hypothetical protein